MMSYDRNAYTLQSCVGMLDAPASLLQLGRSTASSRGCETYGTGFASR